MRIVIVDDVPLFRDGVARLLEGQGVEVVGTAGDVPGALSLVAQHVPDVALLDIRMPPTHTREGLDAALAIRDRHPGVGVVVLSQYVESAWAFALLGDGAGRTGYLLKERVADAADLLASLERVRAGGTVIDPEVVAALVGRARAHDPLESLTGRERDVLSLMAEGRSNRAIAERLFLGEKTVDTHVRAILQKLDIAPTADDNRRVLAVLAYLRGRQS